MFELIRTIFGIGKSIVGKAGEDADKAQERQAKINEAEISGAPNSILRLWRSALGWCLAISFVWEIMARPVIMTYWPQVTLPPSFIKETMSILLGMLGLGF